MRALEVREIIASQIFNGNIDKTAKIAISRLTNDGVDIDNMILQCDDESKEIFLRIDQHGKITNVETFISEMEKFDNIQDNYIFNITENNSIRPLIQMFTYTYKHEKIVAFSDKNFDFKTPTNDGEIYNELNSYEIFDAEKL